MRAGTVTRVEKNIDRTASAALALAVAYAAYTYLSLTAGQPVLGAETGGAGALAYLFCARALGVVRPAAPRYPVPIFDLRKIDSAPMQELLLTDEDRLEAPAEQDQPDQPLVLDDILAEIGPDSRVVRLFDPAAMPTPGQLNARIEHHLGQGESAAPDDSQALYDALSELRRSLR